MQALCADDNKILITDLNGFVKPFVPDIPDNGVEHALRQAMIEFASKTLILKRYAQIDIQENVRDYFIEDTSEECVYMLQELCVGDSCIWHRIKQTQCSTWCGMQFQTRTPNCVIVNPAPVCDQVGALKVSYFTVPSQESCFVPDEIYKVYAETIAAMAIANLLLVNGNEALARKAGIWQQKAQRGIGKAKVDGVFSEHWAGPRKIKPRIWI